ncbi:hypothetical protein WA1_17660 [Scytonema hofmannii PCC 7110]|uniref:histidine kinase n=1 Tax=Scytonema hofmannii PCC 7110 TaxID=128403 RepID=A0A139XAW4_9CYAN|nr:PAS domain S-box protein [Scytonema hofmannii]KYC41847.1 hypothetical protein WA1_17660 [Scytonema hofmannii PCC 7110]
MYTEQKVNILLVDDRPENLLALVATLETLEQNLVTATSGEEALKYILQMDFAVILLDVHMPGLNGFETAEIIRTRQRNQNTPIIFLTAYSRSENFIFQGYSVGAVDYMLKPIVPEILISKVVVFIELFKKTAEIKQQAERLADSNKFLQKQIKEHQQTEKLLRKREGEFAAIFRAIPDVIIFVNKDGLITIANPAVSTVFGYEPEELIGKKYQFLCHKSEEEISCCKIQCFQRKFQNNIENYYRKNGEKFIGETINTFVDDSEGNIIGFLHIIRDITERKQAEEKIANLYHQNQLILQSAGEGIYGINRDGKTIFINPAASKMLGYQVEELIEQPIDIILNHTKYNNKSPIYQSLKNGTVQNVTKEEFLRKDGSSFPVEYVSTPIIENDETAGAVITFKDITERNMIERMKDEFISVVSHEIRTPLTSIQGSLSLLLSGKLNVQSDKGKRVIQIAADGSERLISLVNDILDLERLTSGAINWVKQRCHAGQLMLKATEMMQTMANNAGITLSVFPQNIELDAAGERIIQVLTNLLSNAIKFSEKGSIVELTVESYPIATSSHCNYVLFKVKDQGRGIPANKLECIFERFQQVDASDSRAKGGTGLGLAICRNIIREHNGKIWVESTEGKGSIFYFTVPGLKAEDKKDDN